MTTIYHNPACSTSRQVLATLRERGIEPRIVEYLHTPPSVAELRDLLARMGLGVREVLRRKEPRYRELELDRPGLDDAALLETVHENPVLLERPIVVTERGTVLCRPAARVLEVLPP